MLLLKFHGALIRKIGYKKGMCVCVHVFYYLLVLKNIRKLSLTSEIHNYGALFVNPLMNYFVTSHVFE